MMELLGYSILEQIYSSDRTVVYRCLREDGTPVAIKILRREYPHITELVQFRNQYTIAKNLKIEGIIKPYNLEPYNNGYALVMEDFGGISLKDHPIYSIQEFLEIVIQVTATLNQIHQQRVIHKDIKPANILINPKTKQVKIIDFSIASLLPRETPQLIYPNLLEGTLAYISPEQTGRMNRVIDYRSDFYSLGITFFELLTGELPFKSDDLMELIHYHIANQPVLAHSINPNIPTTLSQIIDKLMAKNAEDRYQTGFGLKYDLEICLKQWQETGNIQTFELGKRDISDRFIIPEKLYGRETEVTTLLAAFERVATNSQSQMEIVLVAGFSGIGKTAIVKEIHKPILRQRGYFIQGKYDQFQRNIPFSGFVQAFRDLMIQLLSESDTEITQWKSKILQALGENAKLIIEVIPELEKIIGKQPNIIELKGNAAQNRFNLIFQKFIKVFTTQEHPLVIFLDDLQWVDLASLKLIQLLTSEAGAEYFLFIGAYRDNEITALHPLILTLEEISKTGIAIHTISLTPLKQLDLEKLIADTLRCSEDFAKPFTEIIYQKTQGNPFFTNQFIKSLQADGLIIFNLEHDCWQCDIAKVKALSLTDDVVDFVTLQLQKLPQETQEVIKLAACIGNQFDLATLAIVCEKLQTETAIDLWKALQAGFVLPISQIYKFFSDGCEIDATDESSDIHISYKFLHDRVQQAAYSLISEDNKLETHLKIGRLLLQNISINTQENNIFEIVNQLNVGVKLITDEAERKKLAELNLIAGKKAKASTAYLAAMKYLMVSIELLEYGWQNEYSLTLGVYEELAEVSYLSVHFEQAERFINTVLQKAQSLLDKIKVYQIQIQTYVAQKQLNQAINIALQVLKMLGVNLPAKPNKVQILLGLAKTKLALLGKQPKDLIYLPEMQDAEKLAAMRILASSCSVTYITNPQLLPLMISSIVDLSIKYGNTALSAYGYASYGVILCTVFQDMESGYQFGQLALQVLEKFSNKEIASKILFMIYNYIKHWHDHNKETITPLLEAYQVGVETGDVEYASWIAASICYRQYFLGQELSGLEQQIQFYSVPVSQFQQATALIYIQIYHQIVLNLLGKSENPSYLVGEVYNIEKTLPLQLQANDNTGLFYSYINQLIISYLFAKYEQALSNANFAEKYLKAVTGSVKIVIFNFYSSLTRLAIYPHAKKLVKKQILKKVTLNQKQMKKWAQSAPMNYLNKYYLVEAEKYQVLGQKIPAMELYNRAIALAKENEYIQEEALANELAAKFYLEWGQDKIAQSYMIEAYYCYNRWGAKAKIDDLITRYPQLLAPVLEDKEVNFQANTINSLHSDSIVIHNSSTLLDLATVIKTSQILSSEIQLENLFSTLIKVILEHSGAKKGTLLLLEGENLLVEANENNHILQSIPLASYHDLPHTIINIVKNSHSTVVVNNIATELRFANDPYIIQHQPQSILCTPIVKQGQLIGVLYLENKLTTGVFTNNRLEVLNFITNQAAISLENARLYNNLKKTRDNLNNAKEELENYNQTLEYQVEKRTQELQISNLRLQEQATQLESALNQLQHSQAQIIQSEKMSSLGQLVAGVAHEINNPVNFIHGNIDYLHNYTKELLRLIDTYQQCYPKPIPELEQALAEVDLGFIQEDLPKLLQSMAVGTDRIREIVLSLRNFSRMDEAEIKQVNIHEGIDSTLMIIQHRFKSVFNGSQIRVIKEYAALPLIECYPGRLNQVFMNLIANAIDAIEEKLIKNKLFIPKITITTAITRLNQVTIKIADNGSGIPEAIKLRLFDPFFTTKPPGKGTGMGLSISYQIITEQHHGSIECISTPFEGTEFVVTIPMKMSGSFH